MTATGLGLYCRGTSHPHLPKTPRGFWDGGHSALELGQSPANWDDWSPNLCPFPRTPVWVSAKPNGGNGG